MKIRAITGIIFVTIMLASMMFGAYIFTASILLLSLFLLDEFYKLTTSLTVKPFRLGGIVLATTICLILANIYLFDSQNLDKSNSVKKIFFCVPIIIAIIIFELYRKQPNPFHNISYTFFGVLFTSLPCYFFYALAFTGETYNSHYPLTFLLLLWSNDVGAYLFGFKFGKHKLFKLHSPNKSWEGFIGGAFLSITVSIVISFFLEELTGIQWLFMSLIIVVVGTLGDLTESMLKRSLHIKDSGSIFPGHGGFLDRFDGLLLAAPMVFVYLHILKIF